MCSLSTFPPPPPEGYVTLCEKNAEMVAVAKCDLQQNKCVKDLHYPDIDISTDNHRSTFLKESARSAFLEKDDIPHKRIIRAWREQGLSGVLEEMSKDSSSQRQEASLLSSSCSKILGAIRWLHSLHGTVFPHQYMPNEDLIHEYSANHNWRASPVRCFAWHPHTTKFAISLTDNSVKVYYGVKDNDIVPNLKHKLQKGVADLAWRPNSASTLAVACQSCVLIWNVDPNSLATRPSTSAVQVLSQQYHAPVTSLAWCPQGSVLLSGSPRDTKIMVWDVAKETHVPLQRVKWGGISLLKWSPDGSKLLSGCPSDVFRVWQTRTWTCEKWSTLTGRVRTACWSPDGSSLLFATTGEPIVYCLTFQPSTGQEREPVIGGSKAAMTLVDLAEVDITGEDSERVTVGGEIQTMAWDPLGERLAVNFRGKNAELIALFQTRLEPTVEMIPCGFVRGLPGETPHHVSFQPRFAEGALLTVVWSTGRLSYIPLYFVSRSSLQPALLYQHSATNGSLQNTQLFSE